MKRLTLILATLGLLIAASAQRPTLAYSCQGSCEEMTMNIVEQCLQNGGGDWCSTAGHMIFCDCMSHECDPPVFYPSCD